MPHAPRVCSTPGCPTIVTTGQCKQHTPTTTQRGYGYAHQRERDRQLAKADGRPCSRCGQPMSISEPLHLDHDDADRTRYRGMSHARCNLDAASAVRHSR